MQITPNEIDSVENIGNLDGSPLKMIKTKGGFYICVGRPKGKIQEEALGAGSHPAIVKYNIEKQYPQAELAMMKSELLSDGSLVDKHSHFLSKSLRETGHDIYSIQNGFNINFYITKHNTTINMIKSELENEYIVIKALNFPKEFSESMSGAAIEKALSCNAKKIKLEKK